MGCVGSTEERMQNIQMGEEVTKKRKHKVSKDGGKSNKSESSREKKNEEVVSPYPNIEERPTQKPKAQPIVPAVEVSKRQPQPKKTLPPLQKAPSTTSKDEIVLNIAQTSLDSHCPMMSSYISKEDTTFWKNNFNWHSIPFNSPWNFKSPSVFSVKNLGIKFNHFMVGIIRQKDIKELTHTPWKTQGVLCYQSNAGTAGKDSWIANGEAVKIPAKTVEPGSILSIVTRKGKAEFWINKMFVGSIKIPASFYMEVCVPYVAVFCSGDSVGIIKNNPLKPYNPPE